MFTVFLFIIQIIHNSFFFCWVQYLGHLTNILDVFSLNMNCIFLFVCLITSYWTLDTVDITCRNHEYYYLPLKSVDSYFKRQFRYSPGGLVVKTLHFHCRGAQVQSLPRGLRSHMLSGCSQGPGWLSLSPPVPLPGPLRKWQRGRLSPDIPESRPRAPRSRAETVLALSSNG